MLKIHLNSSFSAVLLDCQRFIEILAKDLQSEGGNLFTLRDSVFKKIFRNAFVAFVCAVVLEFELSAVCSVVHVNEVF